MSAATIERPTRFQNNTTAAPVDRRRHLGFMPGMHMAMMTPLGSNQQTEIIPQGQLIVFNPRVERNVDPDWKPKQDEYSGQRFLDRVAARFQFGESDWGFRALDMLDPLEYDEATGWDEADAYFDVVHPSFEALGKVCESGLEIGEKDVNLDVPMPCPTCRLEFLNSKECTARISASGLDTGILNKLKTAITDSYRVGRAFHNSKLRETDGDIMKKSNGQPGKGFYDDADLVFARTLHKKAAHIEQAEAMANSARITGEAIGKNMSGGGNDPLAGMSDAEKAEFYAWKAAKNGEKVDLAGIPSVAVEVPQATVPVSNDVDASDEPGNPDIGEGSRVTFEGQPALVNSVNHSWCEIDLGGETRKVRRSQLELYTGE